MTNWITNEVTFTHDNPHKLEEMVNIFENEQPFKHLIPEPDWSNTPNENGDLPEKELKRRYDWKRENWGCKWDIDKVEIDYQVANNMVFMIFTTPWTAPKGIYRKLCEIGYECFSWYWKDEGIPESGNLVKELGQ